MGAPFTFSSPPSPPQAIHPWLRFHPSDRSFTPFGIAIFLLRYTNMIAPGSGRWRCGVRPCGGGCVGGLGVGVVAVW